MSGGEGPECAAGLLTTEPPGCPDPANIEHNNLIFLSVSIVMFPLLISRDEYENNGKELEK